MKSMRIIFVVLVTVLLAGKAYSADLQGDKVTATQQLISEGTLFVDNNSSLQSVQTTDLTVEGPLTVGDKTSAQAVNVFGSLTATQSVSSNTVSATDQLVTKKIITPVNDELTIQSPNLQVNEMGLRSTQVISTSESITADSNIQAGGNISASGDITSAKLNFSAQKICFWVSPNHFRGGSIVPNSWTSSACKNFATESGFSSDFQLGCIFENSHSLSKLSSMTAPNPNCGW